MATTFRPLLFLCVLISIFFSSSAQSFANHTFSNRTGVYSSYIDLPVLNSSLYWTYYSSFGTVQIAYRHTGLISSRWFAWAINPTSSGMIGSQALVAYQQTNGSLAAYTSPVTSFGTQLLPGNLSFTVLNLSAEFTTNEMTIFATLELPNNITTVNHVWQEGPLLGNTPVSHSTSGANVQSMGTLDFLSGQIAT